MVAFATQVKRRRGTTAQNDEFTGAEGEIVVDTEKHTLRVHDGETQGGFEMARQSDVDDKADTTYVDTQLALKADTDLSNIPSNYDYVIESQEPTADNNYTWYRLYKSGWVEMGGRLSTGSSGWLQITLPVEMLNDRYGIWVTPTDGTENKTTIGVKISADTVTTTSFRVSASYNSDTYLNTRIYWQVSGMSAQ